MAQHQLFSRWPSSHSVVWTVRIWSRWPQHTLVTKVITVWCCASLSLVKQLIWTASNCSIAPQNALLHNQSNAPNRCTHVCSYIHSVGTVQKEWNRAEMTTEQYTILYDGMKCNEALNVIVTYYILCCSPPQNILKALINYTYSQLPRFSSRERPLGLKRLAQPTVSYLLCSVFPFKMLCTWLHNKPLSSHTYTTFTSKPNQWLPNYHVHPKQLDIKQCMEIMRK